MLHTLQIILTERGPESVALTQSSCCNYYFKLLGYSSGEVDDIMTSAASAASISASLQSRNLKLPSCLGYSMTEQLLLHWWSYPSRQAHSDDIYQPSGWRKCEKKKGFCLLKRWSWDRSGSFWIAELSAMVNVTSEILSSCISIQMENITDLIFNFHVWSPCGHHFSFVECSWISQDGWPQFSSHMRIRSLFPRVIGFIFKSWVFQTEVTCTWLQLLLKTNGIAA